MTRLRRKPRSSRRGPELWALLGAVVLILCTAWSLDYIGQDPIRQALAGVIAGVLLLVMAVVMPR